MTKTLEVVEAIRNGDERRIEFFVKKLSNDLKQYDLNISVDELRNRFINSVNNFNGENANSFYFSILKEIKDDLKKEYSINIIGNKLFNEVEMTILNYYLNDIDGAYYSNDDIAKKLNIPVINVIKVADRIKSLYVTNRSEIKDIFSNTDRLYLEVSKKQVVPKIKITPIITEEELNYLGLYTGQINDICLDAKEIAEMFNSTEFMVNFKLKGIFELLKNKKNLKIVLNKYPSIMPFLKIKAKTLDLDFLDDTTKKKNKTPNVSVEKAVKFLKYYYQKNDNGTYYTNEELAKLLNVKESYISTTRYNIFRLYKEEALFKTQILSFYPDFEHDVEVYENWKKNKNKYEKYEEIATEYAYLFKMIYKKNENGKYSTIKSVAEKLDIGEELLYRRNRELLNILDKNPILRELILQKYPTLLIDKRDYDVKVTVREKRSEHSLECRDSKIENYVELLKLFYKINKNGSYNNRKEIANTLFISVEYVSTKHRIIIDAFDNDENIKNEILMRYPEFLEDRRIYRESKSLYRNKELRNSIKVKKKALEYSEFLKVLFSKKEDGSYYKPKELEVMLDIDRSYICNKKKNVLNTIDKNEEIKNSVIEIYPTFVEDRLEYESCDSNKSKKSKKGIVKAKENKLSLDIAKYAMSKDENERYRTIKEICKKFSIREATIEKKINYIADALEANDKEIIKLVEEYYPEFLEDKEKYDELDKSTLVIEKPKVDIERVNTYVKFLKQCYTPNEDGSYCKNKEIAKQFNIKSSGVNVKRHQIFTALAKDKELKRCVYELYPELDNDIAEHRIYFEEQRRKDSDSTLSKIEMIVSEELYKDVTKKVIPTPELARKLHIKENSLLTIKSNALRKIKENEELQKQYPTAADEKIIRKVSLKTESILIDDEEVNNIKSNIRAYDIPNIEVNNTKNSLLQGIENLSNSIYKDYVELCTYEQKAILALRLGFFNNTIYGSSDVAELFNIKDDEVKLLTDQCLDLCCRKEKSKEKIKIK